MREEKKMSSFTPMTCVDAITNGYGVPVCKEDVGNGLVLVRELAGICDAGALTDASIVTVQNNALSTLTTAQSTLMLRVYCQPGEIPNFAVEITTTTAVTLAVVKVVDGGGAAVATELKYSAAGGNELESGKTYQVTCVGSCWTVAEFVDPDAQRSIDTPDNRSLNDLPEDSSSEGGDDEYILPEERGSDER